MKLSVSIPKRVSAKVERDRRPHPLNLRLVSIPKRVSAKVERWQRICSDDIMMFQSLKGFQPKWNHSVVKIEDLHVVSIPKRVSAKVEPSMALSIGSEP